MANEIPLGELADSKAKRDAVHVAIAPVLAGEDLEPGSRVIVQRFGLRKAYRATGEGTGVVDPFLTKTVLAGERFFVVLRPHTTTPIRHEWSHPDFDVVDDGFECSGSVPEEPEEEPAVEMKLVVNDRRGPWDTDAVRGMCRKMMETQDYSAFPVLADALEESGFTESVWLEMEGDDYYPLLKKLRSLDFEEEYDKFRLAAIFCSQETHNAVDDVESHGCYLGDLDFSSTMYAADRYIQCGAWGDDDYSRASLEDWADFWDAYYVLTGKRPGDTGMDQIPDSCSC